MYNITVTYVLLLLEKPDVIMEFYIIVLNKMNQEKIRTYLIFKQ